MPRHHEIFSPETRNTISSVLMAAKYFSEKAHVVLAGLNPILNKLLNDIKFVIESPQVQHLVCVHTHKTLFHPTLVKVVPHGFTEEDLISNWPRIKDELVARFPLGLDKEFRIDRYIQILDCQTIGSYIAVCRSIYPEIEALLRDEILLEDETWKREWIAKKDSKSRASFQSQQINDLIKNKLTGYELANPSATLDEVGVYTAQFIWVLEKSFEKFDPAKLEDSSRQSFRHLHAHGWSKKATFIDGLNGLLTYDLALQVVAEKLEKNARANEGAI